MNPDLTLQNIRLSQIDFDDYSYTISPEHETVVDETLKKSLARYGILHPPIIRENNSGFYSIAAGRKRLLAASLLYPENACTCLVIPVRIPEISVFHILLEEIQLTRQLTAVERAIFLQKITGILDETQITKEFLPRLGLAANPFVIKQTVKLLELEDYILQSIHYGNVNEAVARGFIPLPAQDRKILFEIITSLRLSASYQKKILSICRELAGRENIDIAALLDDDEVGQILHHKDANPPQKTKKLMTWLSGKYMPRSRQAEKEFKRFTMAMQLPPNVSIEHTPFFEDDSMTLSITYTNRKSLQHAWEKIKNATHSKDN
ncbi:MAG: ParB N-terminal domain-containing protein [Deltaproteobacteria bacterium]|nr:MAG: ParB N-terminal domain-containing protein [Deltaproteobacteria bacterium]